MREEQLNSLLNFLGVTKGYKDINRQILYSDGSTETDALHVLQMINLFIATSHLLPTRINKFLMIKMMTLHDIGELITNDILFKTEEQRNNENAAAMAILEDFPHLQGVYSLYEERVVEEAKLVKEIDILQATIEIYLSGGKTWKKMKRTYEQEIQLYPCDSNSIYSNMIREIREKAKEEGLFF